MAFLVVALHGRLFEDIHPSISFLTVNGICRIAVPFFFIINGYFFGSINTRQKLLKWVKRAIILYVTWTLFYFVFNSFLVKFTNFNFSLFWNYLISGWWHLWYLKSMIVACLLVYCFRNKVKLGCVLSLVLFVIGVVLQYSVNYDIIDAKTLPLSDYYNLHHNGIFFGFPFCYIGYILGRSKFNFDVSIRKHTWIVICAVGLLMAESMFGFYRINKKADIYLSLIMVVPLLFLLVMRLHVSMPQRMLGLSKKLALVSTAIYLIHIFWLATISLFFDRILDVNLNPTPKTIAAIILSVISSYILILINKRLKFIL